MLYYSSILTSFNNFEEFSRLYNDKLNKIKSKSSINPEKDTREALISHQSGVGSKDSNPNTMIGNYSVKGGSIDSKIMDLEKIYI